MSCRGCHFHEYLDHVDSVDEDVDGKLGEETGN